MKALICAARNGKKVTVVIELLARFDEASNIDWSKKMQDAGIHVIFGVEGLKVHSKITHIGMKTGSDIACISTGNFHEGNARMYTDYMLMTASRSVVREVNSVFTFIEKPYSPVHFKELLVSPNEMKLRFIRLINDEIKNRQSGRPAYIRVKVNHITDSAIVKKLYEASAAGVPVDMLVRGNCSLVTGIPGISDTIHISGIIDQGIFKQVALLQGYTQNDIDVWWGVYTGKYKLLINVPISIASAMAASFVPVLTGAYHRDDMEAVRGQINLSTRFIMVVAFPCAVGLAVFGLCLLYTSPSPRD